MTNRIATTIRINMYCGCDGWLWWYTTRS